MAKEKKQPEKNEIATAKKDIELFGGWLGRLENPDPVLRTEASGKGIKLYDEIARDAHAGGVLEKRYRSVVGKEWDIVPASDQGKDAEIADFVKEVFLSCNYDLGREKLLGSVLYGFAVSEIMWQISEGDIWIDKFLDKKQYRFAFTVERDLRLLTPTAMINGEPVPDRKFIIFTYGSADNPYGEGLGRRLWWPLWFKKNGIKFWVMFAEKFGGPTAVGKYPPGADKTDQDKLLAAIGAIHQETGVIIPETMAIDLLEAARASSINTYETLCNFMNAEISKTVLGGTLTTEIGKTGGAYSAAATHEEAEQGIVKADADALCACLNKTAVRWLVDYNFGPQKKYPKVWVRTEPEKDLKALADRDKILVREIGVPVAKKYFYDNYNLPQPEAGEDLVSPPAAPLPMFSERSRARSSAPLHFVELSPGSEEEMERQRQRLIFDYFTELKKGTAAIRAAALDDISSYMLGAAGAGEEELSAGVLDILRRHYGAEAEEIAAAVKRAVEPLYSFYRLTDKSIWQGEKPPVDLVFDPRDQATLEAVQKIDRFYLSKYIHNQDMQDPVMKFVKDQYLEKGQGLFGRGAEDEIAGFRGQFDDHLSHMEDWQIRRIIDTSVTRMRSLADLGQGVQAGFDLKVHVTRRERACPICQGHAGEIVKAQQMEIRMLTAAMDPEKFGIFNDVPPFHPNCACRLIAAI
jgi:phage gp29-like protein